jgi:molybdenum cofactor guanylyltransferase
MTITGLILAGGRSSRMGSNKARQSLGDDTLIARAAHRLGTQVARLAVSANEPLDVSGTIPILPDTVPNFAGPLAGILAGLRWAQALPEPPNFIAIIPVDAPFFPNDLITKLSHQTPPNFISVARLNGETHQTFSLWPVSLAGVLEIYLQNHGSLKLMDFIASQNHRYVDFEAGQGFDPFMNINTPDDLKAAELILKNL